MNNTVADARVFQNEENLPNLPTANAQKMTRKAPYFEYGRSMSSRIGTRPYASHEQESFGGEE